MPSGDAGPGVRYHGSLPGAVRTPAGAKQRGTMANEAGLEFDVKGGH